MQNEMPRKTLGEILFRGVLASYDDKISPVKTPTTVIYKNSTLDYRKPNNSESIEAFALEQSSGVRCLTFCPTIQPAGYRKETLLLRGYYFWPESGPEGCTIALQES